MTPQRLRQVEEIFSRVVDLPLARRPIALQEFCGRDSLLRAEVETLLQHADLPADFLASPALGTQFELSNQIEDDLEGRMIGPYQVIRRWASGGMGTVYFAARADGHFDQHVAIKVVKRGMDSDEILRRFTHERRTLATLSHPNIARLLDGGALPDGRPYLVMEYVKGIPIDRYCDEYQLNTTARLRLFCTVCDAVRFAHQKLVIHRYLKPGNVLVDESGSPKLLDFGIAKVFAGTGSREVTVASERRFTPEYASPEQVAGQPLTTATDVYSLGVILYELLTGRRPYHFTTRNAQEVERVVRDQDPLPPSTAVNSKSQPSTGTATNPEEASRVRNSTPDRLRRRLSGDIDTIVLKAMQKDATRRYASVDPFVADIERHLTGLPVLARPDTLRYRMNKFVRRNAIAVTIGFVAMTTLVGGLGSAVWQARIARRERDAAYVARDQAEATSDFFQGMLAAADPANEGNDARVRTILDAAALRLDGDLKNQPLVQASIRSTVGRTYLSLGLMEQAEDHIRAAYEARTSLLEPGHHDIAESDFDMAQLLYAQGKFAEAEDLLNQSLTAHQRLRGAHNLDTARVWNDLGAVRRAGGRNAEAEDALRQALAIREALAGRESLEVAETLNNLSGVLRAKGDMLGAEKLMTESHEIRRRLLRDEHPLVIQGIANLAVIASARGDLKRAESMLLHAVELDRKVFGNEHLSLAVDLTNLGRVLMLEKRFHEAEPLLRESFEIRRRRLGPADEKLLRTQAALGDCLFAQGQDSEAAPLMADALQKVGADSRSKDAFWVGISKKLDEFNRRSR